MWLLHLRKLELWFKIWMNCKEDKRRGSWRPLGEDILSYSRMGGEAQHVIK